MSELNNQLIESGGSQEQESLESLIPGLDIESFRDRIKDIHKVPELYKKLIILVKENLPIERGLKLSRIITRIEDERDREERVMSEKKEEVVEKKEEVVEKKEDEKQARINENREKSKIAVRENTQAIDSINTSLAPELKGRLDEEVEKKLQDIQSGQSSDRTNEFLQSVGINSPEDIQNPENQTILRARISTQVYLKEAENNLEFRTQFSKEIETLERNAPILGIEQSATAKNVEKLTTDLPRDTRGQVVDTITSLTKSNPDTIVTRTGDTLRFTDPRNEKYSYEIDLGREPPRLAKSLNGLSISRELTPVSKEEQEYKEKIDILKQKQAATQEAQGDYKEFVSGYEFIQDMTKLSREENFKSEIERKTRLLDEYSKTTNIIERKEILSKIESINEGIKVKIGDSMKVEDIMSGSTKFEISDRLTGESIKLRTLQQALTAEIQAQKDIPDAPAKNIDNVFESTAAYNLNFLSYIGYDTLGQDGLERIIERLNSPSNPRRSELGEIRLGDKLDRPQTQALTLAIANLVRGGRQSGIPTTPEQLKQEKEQKTWDGVDKTDPIIAARQTQSFGFRDSLLSVRRNMTQEGGSLKTRGQLDKALFGIESLPEKNDSAINTTEITGTSLA